MFSVVPDFEWLNTGIFDMAGGVLPLVMILLFFVFASGIIWWMAARGGTGVFDGAGGKAKIVAAVFGSAALTMTPAYVPWLMDKFGTVKVAEEEYDFGVVTVAELKALDSDGDGTVSVLEMDTDNDGVISADEARAANKSAGDAAGLSKELESVSKDEVKKYDTDGSGVLSLAELDKARDECMSSTGGDTAQCEDKISAIRKAARAKVDSDAKYAAYNLDGGSQSVPKSASECATGTGRVTTGYDHECLKKMVTGDTRHGGYFLGASNNADVVLIKSEPKSKKDCASVSYVHHNINGAKIGAKKKAQLVCEAWWDSKSQYPSGGMIDWPVAK